MRVLGIFDRLEQRSAQLHRVKRCWLIERLGVFEIIVIQKLVIFIVVNLDFDDGFVGSAALFFLALFPLGVGSANADIVDFLNYKKSLSGGLKVGHPKSRIIQIQDNPNDRCIWTAVGYSDFSWKESAQFVVVRVCFFLLSPPTKQRSCDVIRLSNCYSTISSKVWMPLMVTIQPWSLGMISLWIKGIRKEI